MTPRIFVSKNGTPRIFLSTLLVLICQGFFSSNTTKAQYTENVIQKPGLIRLNTDIVAEDYVWFVYYPPQTDFVKTNNGKTCVFAACKSGVTYSVALTAIDYTNKKSFQKIFFVEISGDAPNPPEPPQPPDDDDNDPPEPPKPNFPDGRFKLSQFTYDNCPKGGDNITLATNLANNYQAVSSSIAAGVISSINAANSDLKVRNRAVFDQYGSVPKEWDDLFQRFGVKMQGLFNAGDIKTVQDLRVALLEIEAGFRGVAK